MYKSALAGLCVLATVVIFQTGKTSAQELTVSTLTPNTQSLTLSDAEVHTTSELKVELEPFEPAQPPAPEPVAQVTYVVEKGETLTSIAKKMQTTWRRLFDKNTALVHPDILTVGETLIIPDATETLAERSLPERVPPNASSRPATQSVRTARASTAATQSVAHSSSAGNRYVPGYCTWYVKNIRTDLPNNLGDASSWVSRASVQGMATGSVPRPGAVGQRGMHVVYVESVNADGSVNITEMNHKGLYVVTERTLPGNYFTYIY